ncbi:MAG: FkbM family methyltransferase [Candidatus Pelagibacterales bacterium]|jgi:FkbM family methyltransferase|tara:strand:+ start:260 stop:1099 length:840 start_codon:yes stop_codon:yes gene_type:complete
MVKNYKLIGLLIFFGQKLFFVRGIFRKLLITSIHRLISFDPSKDPTESRVGTVVDGVPFFFYFDGMSETKQILGSYNKKEINFIKNNTNKNSIFIDIGANIGFYSQNIAATFNNTKFSKIIAIEPNPVLVRRIEDNITLLETTIPNIKNRVIIENCAVGSSKEDIYLDLNEGYGNARVKSKKSNTAIPIKMLSLLEIIKKNKIEYITNLKIDVEGYEDKALKPFFENAPSELFPQNIVIEYTSQSEWEDKKFIKYLLEKGYKEVIKTRGNLCLSLNVGS